MTALNYIPALILPRSSLFGKQRRRYRFCKCPKSLLRREFYKLGCKMSAAHRTNLQSSLRLGQSTNVRQTRRFACFSCLFRRMIILKSSISVQGCLSCLDRCNYFSSKAFVGAVCDEPHTANIGGATRLSAFSIHNLVRIRKPFPGVKAWKSRWVGAAPAFTSKL